MILPSISILYENTYSHRFNSSIFHFVYPFFHGMLQIQGVLLWKREEKSIAAEHFVKSAKLNPENGVTFRYLGDYYAHVSVDSQRAIKCYQRAVTLNPDDSDAGEAMCDLLDQGGKESLEISVCREASFKSPRAFWAFRRLGFLQVFLHFLFPFTVQFLLFFLFLICFYVDKWQLYHRKWSEAVQSLQHAIRGYPACADLWEVVLSVLKLSSLFLFNLDESELIGSYIWCIFRVWVLPTSDWECLLLQLRYLFSFLLVT